MEMGLHRGHGEKPQTKVFDFHMPAAINDHVRCRHKSMANIVRMAVSNAANELLEVGSGSPFPEAPRLRRVKNIFEAQPVHMLVDHEQHISRDDVKNGNYIRVANFPCSLQVLRKSIADLGVHVRVGQVDHMDAHLEVFA